MFKCFAYIDGNVVASGRAVADSVDCSYSCNIAVHPEYQGKGLGIAVIQNLIEQSQGHRKIILYAVPGKEKFYKQFGFGKMRTAMAILKNLDQALQYGLIKDV